MIEVKDYYYLVMRGDEKTKKVKGVNKNVAKNIRYNEHVDLLFSRGLIRHGVKRIQIKLHKIGTYDVCKIYLFFDDKRYILDDGFSCLVCFYKDVLGLISSLKLIVLIELVILIALIVLIKSNVLYRLDWQSNRTDDKINSVFYLVVYVLKERGQQIKKKNKKTKLSPYSKYIKTNHLNLSESHL